MQVNKNSNHLMQANMEQNRLHEEMSKGAFLLQALAEVLFVCFIDFLLLLAHKRRKK